jgi:hypothetical protein
MTISFNLSVSRYKESHIVKGQLKDKDIDRLIEIVKDWRVSVGKKQGDGND